MSVKIPIEADVQKSVREIDQIAAALGRAGQQAQKLSDIDFSHPELKELQADLTRIQKQWEDILRLKQGKTSQRVQQGVAEGAFTGPLDFPAGAARQVPDPAQQRAYIDNVLGRVLEGTRFDPDLTPVPRRTSSGGSGPAETSEEKENDREEGEAENRVRSESGPAPEPTVVNASGAGGAGGAAGGASRGAGGAGGGVDPKLAALSRFRGGPVVGAMLGAAGIGGGLRSITSHVQQAEREQVMNDSLMRRMGDTSTGFAELLHNVRNVSSSLHVLQTEGQSLTEEWVRIANESRSGAALANVEMAGNVARGYGVAPSTMVQGFARASFAGEDPRRFALMLADAVQDGHMNAQADKVQDSLLTWLENANRQGQDRGAEDFSRLMTSMNASGDPMVRGENGVNLINTANASISHGGGAGMAGQVMSLMTMIRHGSPSVYDAQYRLSKGMFSRAPDGTMILNDVMEEIQKTYRGRPDVDRFVGGGNYMGMSPAHYEQFERYWRSAQTSQAANGGVDGYLRKIGVDTNKLNMSGLNDIMQTMDSHADLGAIRQRLMARTDLSTADRTALRDTGTSDPEALRAAEVRAFANSGLENTMGRRVADSGADASNVLTNAASTLVGPITQLREEIAKLQGPVETIAEQLGDGTTGESLTSMAGWLTAGAAGILGPGIAKKVLTSGFRGVAGAGGAAAGAAATGAAEGGAVAAGVTVGGALIAGGGALGIAAPSLHGAYQNYRDQQKIAAFRNNPELIAKARRYMTYFEQHDHLTHAGASVLVGGLEQESGLDANAVEHHRDGSVGPGYGLAQWTDPTRVRAFKEAEGVDLRHSTEAQQLDFMSRELNGDYRKQLTLLQKLGPYADIGEASRTFGYGYEGYGIEGARGGYADVLNNLPRDLRPADPAMPKAMRSSGQPGQGSVGGGRSGDTTHHVRGSVTLLYPNGATQDVPLNMFSLASGPPVSPTPAGMPAHEASAYGHAGRKGVY
ncbi:phage tail tip lysozyme [Novacetimonas hansenii]|uniref:phage tail tip lysozyme n=1 Tax=Novacetimonas hansenii TaxID=436 RepID=UPI00094FBF0B|nr:phage tail tip lysozyme [Novacetimonas hansenii]